MKRARKGKIRRPAVLLAAALMILAAVPLSRAEDQDKSSGKKAAKTEETRKSEESSQKRESKPRVYTNKDLEKYASRIKSRPAGKVVDMTQVQAPPPDANQPAPMSAQERDRQVADLQTKISQAESRMKEIDARVLSLHNPYVPRPEVSDAEKLAEAGMDGAQIMEKVLAEKQGLQGQVDAWQAELDKLQAEPVEPAEAAEPAAGEAAGESSEPPPQQP